MDASLLEDKPIFKLARECERLFQRHAAAVQHHASSGEALVLSELKQRFSGWAVYLGIFATPENSLDRKLQSHGEIRQQVLFLLDIIRRNLYYSKFLFLVFLEEKRASDVGKNDPAAQHDVVSIDALEAVEKAIKRFGQVGIAIRRSPSTRQSAKIRNYATSIDSADFQKLAHTAIRILYPDATHGLLEHLASSMTETYAVFRRRDAQNKHVQSPQRIVAQGLGVISEEPADGSVMVEIHDQPSNEVKTNILHRLNEANSKATQGALLDPSSVARSVPPDRAGQVAGVAPSEPTTVDSHAYRSYMRRFTPSATRKTKSILGKHADYPRPSGRGEHCDWCFQPFPDGLPQGEDWQKHLHEDHKPYACISEQCFESLTRFASSAKWLEHMTTCHGPTWTREVHAPTSWICPFCDKDTAVFDRPDDLALHLEGLHVEFLREAQVPAVVRQSRLHSPRAPDTCPLCCFSVSQQHDRKLMSVDQGARASTSMGQTRTRTKQPTSAHNRAREPSALGSSVQSCAETAAHVATHLQDIMLLCLRLIPVHVKAPDADETQSMASSQYNISSITRWSQGDLSQEAADDDILAGESSSFVMPESGDQEYDPSSQTEPPDAIDEPFWDAIPRPDFHSGNDDILDEMAKAKFRTVDPISTTHTLEGHEGYVYSVAFSPDHQKVASGSADGTIKIWSVPFGGRLRTWTGHQSIVYSVAFSPNGQLLASGSWDRTVRIWDVSTTQCLRLWEHDWREFAGSFNSVTFSPDGQQLASGLDDDTIKIWNVATGQCLRTWKHIQEDHDGSVYSVTFSPDGQQLASGSSVIRIWNTVTGQCLQTWKGHTSAVRSVAFSPDGLQIASGSDDKTIKIWNVASGQCLRTLKGHTSAVSSVAISPDGQLLASGSWDNDVRIWNVTTGQSLQTLDGHTRDINSVVFSPDGKELASGSDDRTIRIWDLLPLVRAN